MPTQIDRFILLKSVVLSNATEVSLEVDGHSSDLSLSVKHFFAFYFEAYFRIEIVQMTQPLGLLMRLKRCALYRVSEAAL
ncbi:hypothetical protein ST37_05340 [Vibrio sp. qd031]|nr:hypothetical protein ST37_05340 [Vibrio sp. qd031]